MKSELGIYASEIASMAERVATLLEGLDESELNWRPPAPETNSLYAIATHVLGNIDAWVLGIVCGKEVRRDRDAEFLARGGDAAELIGRARRLSGDVTQTLEALPSSALDEKRHPKAPLLGIGPQDELTVREALMRVLVHGRAHIGHMQLTRDLALAHAEK